MFDMGFIDDIRYLARKLPPPDQRQSFLYSATLSHRVLELAYEHMNRVERIAVAADRVTADNIAQIVYHVGMGEKLPLLLGLLEREQPSRALVFVNTRTVASKLADHLVAQGYEAGALAGDMDQRKRLRLLGRLKDGSLKILVATDVASRGLHIDEVSHVFNYDLPQDPEDYVHRIGRTARAGASGKAISLACERYVYSLEAIEEFIDSKIPHEFADSSMLVTPVRFHYSRTSDRADGGRGKAGRSGRTPRSSRSHGRAKAGTTPVGTVPPPSTSNGATTEGDGAAKKKRKRSRRRRKKPAASMVTSQD
jgi:ATP-dependent RNA helicase RhlB